MDATPAAKASGETKAPAHTPSTMFLWVLGLTAFTLNLGYGIVLPISEKLAVRCGAPGGGDEGTIAAFTVMALSLMSFNLAKVMGEVPGGIFSDRVGDRVVVASSLFIYAISVVILIWARHPTLFTTARFIEGFATGVSYPSMTSVLIRHSPPAKLGRNMSIGMGSGVAGFILGPVIAGPLTSESLHSRIGVVREAIDIPLWLCFFLSLGVFALVTAWFWTAATRSQKGDLTDIAAERKAVVADSLVIMGPGPTVSAPAPDESFLEACGREFRVILRFAKSPLFLGLVSPLFFVKLIMCSWQVLLFPHVKYLGMGGVDAVGRLMAILAACLAVLTPISGYLADRFSSRWLTHGALVGTVASLALMLVAPAWTFTALWVAYSCFSAILINVHLKFVGDTYHEEQQHGRIFGIVHALSDLGMILGPPLIWLYTANNFGRIATFLLMAGVGGLSVPAFMLSQGREKQLPRP